MSVRTSTNGLVGRNERITHPMFYLPFPFPTKITGFTLNGTVKILDFGLAKIVENASPDRDDVYVMSGETGSLRYMAPGMFFRLGRYWYPPFFSLAHTSKITFCFAD